MPAIWSLNRDSVSTAMVIVRIAVPTWARPFTAEIDAAVETHERRALHDQHAAIMASVDQAVRRYLEDPQLTFDSAAEGFPSRDRLTGEYYVAQHCCWVNDEPWFQRVGRPREVNLGIMVHCLEHAWHTGRVDRDYLGLEIHFLHDAESGKFVHTGDVDSSSI